MMSLTLAIFTVASSSLVGGQFGVDRFEFADEFLPILKPRMVFNPRIARDFEDPLFRSDVENRELDGGGVRKRENSGGNRRATRRIDGGYAKKTVGWWRSRPQLRRRRYRRSPSEQYIEYSSPHGIVRMGTPRESTPAGGLYHVQNQIYHRRNGLAPVEDSSGETFVERTPRSHFTEGPIQPAAMPVLISKDDDAPFASPPSTSYHVAVTHHPPTAPSSPDESAAAAIDEYRITESTPPVLSKPSFRSPVSEPLRPAKSKPAVHNYQISHNPEAHGHKPPSHYQIHHSHPTPTAATIHKPHATATTTTVVHHYPPQEDRHPHPPKVTVHYEEPTSYHNENPLPVKYYTRHFDISAGPAPSPSGAGGELIMGPISPEHDAFPHLTEQKHRHNPSHMVHYASDDSGPKIFSNHHVINHHHSPAVTYREPVVHHHHEYRAPPQHHHEYRAPKVMPHHHRHEYEAPAPKPRPEPVHYEIDHHHPHHVHPTPASGIHYHMMEHHRDKKPEIVYHMVHQPKSVRHYHPAELHDHPIHPLFPVSHESSAPKPQVHFHAPTSPKPRTRFPTHIHDDVSRPPLKNHVYHMTTSMPHHHQHPPTPSHHYQMEHKPGMHAGEGHSVVHGGHDHSHYSHPHYDDSHVFENNAYMRHMGYEVETGYTLGIHHSDTGHSYVTRNGIHEL